MTTTVPRPTTARPRVALRDRVLRLVEFATTPLLPSDYLDLIDPLRSGADLRGRIEAVAPETRDAATLVMLDQATGDFTLPSPAPAKVLFLTAGSGITPVMGMLRNHLGELADVAQVHCAPTASDVIFASELQAYAADGRLALTVNLDDEHGVLDLARLDALVPDWRERETWTCGPTGLLDAAEAHWAGADVADRLHTERFRPTVVEPGEGGEITFLNSDLTVEADGGTPILDAGEEAGVLMPSGCRMGICFGCVVTMRQGAVRDLRTGDITVVEPGDELPVQTCINAVAGSCDIEL